MTALGQGFWRCFGAFYYVSEQGRAWLLQERGLVCLKLAEVPAGCRRHEVVDDGVLLALAEAADELDRFASTPGYYSAGGHLFRVGDDRGVFLVYTTDGVMREMSCEHLPQGAIATDPPDALVGGAL